MIYVGIDVAKKKFYYCIIDIELKGCVCNYV